MCITDVFFFFFKVFSAACNGQAGPPVAVACQIHNDRRLPQASEHLGRTAPNRSPSTPCKQTWRVNTWN